MNGTVYLLHFDPPYKQARHYIGWTSRPAYERLDEHVRGIGSPLVKAAVAAGSTVTITRLWFGVDRHFERALKNRKEAPRMCPTCVNTDATGGRRALADEPGQAVHCDNCGRSGLLPAAPDCDGRCPFCGNWRNELDALRETEPVAA